jgi:sugar phosphate permease
MTFSTLARVIPKILGGTIVDYRGGKKMFVAGLMGMVIGCLAFPLGDSLWWMALSLCSIRICGTITWPAVVKITSKWFRYTEVGAVMGFLSLSYLFGTSVSLAYLGMFMHVGVGWRGLFVIASCTSFCFVILLLVFLRGSPRALGYLEVDSDPKNRLGEYGNQASPDVWMDVYKPIIASKAFWVLCIFYSGLYLLRQVFFDWTALFLQEQTGVELPLAAFGLICFNVSGGVSVVLSGVWADKLTPRRRNLCMAFYCLLLSGTLAVWSILLWQYNFSNIWLNILMLVLCGFTLIGPYSMPAGVISIKFGGKQICATVSGLLDGFGSLVSLFSGLTLRISVNHGWFVVWGSLSVVAAAIAIFAFIYAVLDYRETKDLDYIRDRTTGTVPPN